LNDFGVPNWTEQRLGSPVNRYLDVYCYEDGQYPHSADVADDFPQFYRNRILGIGRVVKKLRGLEIKSSLKWEDLVLCSEFATLIWDRWGAGRKRPDLGLPGGNAPKHGD
jgi:hypothetical protein